MKIEQILSMLVCVALAASTGLAATTVADGDWGNVATWGGPVPGAGETAIVNHNVTLSSPSAALADATINGTLTFDGWNTILSAGTVTIGGSGTVTHNVNTDLTNAWTPDNRVYIQATDVTVTGEINVDVKGYLGGVTASRDGRGPGGGSNACGGGYGGKGGKYYSAPASAVGQPYGSETEPIGPGSGGAYGDGDGRPGGGAVRIDASGMVTVDGLISADGGGSNAHMYYGGGSGGSIYVTADTFAGAGDLTATGGGQNNPVAWGYNKGGGGGGRIAVHYGNWSAAAVGFDVSEGTVWGSPTPGDPGTIYLERVAQPVEIPEPATLSLLAVGAIGLVARRRRKA